MSGEVGYQCTCLVASVTANEIKFLATESLDLEL